jgi:hypothetical protein
VREEDRFIIPKGFIRISLDPSTGGKLFRSGLPFFLKQLFLAGTPDSPEGLRNLMEAYRQEADTILKGSDLLRDLNFDSKDIGEQVFSRLKEHDTKREWWAFLMGASSDLALDALDLGDLHRFAWAVHRATVCRSMVVATEPVFEQTLWRGYVANQVVYEAAAAAVQTPAEAEAIRALRPLFERLDEATLHAWVESGLPIGPRLGVSALAEAVLAALAKWHLELFERRRQEEKAKREERRAVRELRIKWLTLGVAIGGMILAILKELLK